MTNKLHRYIRECEQDRKYYFRYFQRQYPNRKLREHNRKWWKAWHKRWKAGIKK